MANIFPPVKKAPEELQETGNPDPFNFFQEMIFGNDKKESDNQANLSEAPPQDKSSSGQRTRFALSDSKDSSANGDNLKSKQ